MVHITDIYELKANLHKLKQELANEDRYLNEKELANKYLNKVLDLVDRIR